MVIIDRMHKHGFKWILVGAALILAAWFGYLNQAYAITYGELNEQREQAGLPPLTRDDEIDFRMLVRECRGGIRYSCALARQLQDPPQQQRVPQYSRQPVQPIPFDLDNPPQYINGGSGIGDECAECLNYHGDSEVKKAFCSSYLATRGCR